MSPTNLLNNYCHVGRSPHSFQSPAAESERQRRGPEGAGAGRWARAPAEGWGFRGAGRERAQATQRPRPPGPARRAHDGGPRVPAAAAAAGSAGPAPGASPGAPDSLGRAGAAPRRAGAPGEALYGGGAGPLRRGGGERTGGRGGGAGAELDARPVGFLPPDGRPRRDPGGPSESGLRRLSPGPEPARPPRCPLPAFRRAAPLRCVSTGDRPQEPRNFGGVSVSISWGQTLPPPPWSEWRGREKGSKTCGADPGMIQASLHFLPRPQTHFYCLCSRLRKSWGEGRGGDRRLKTPSSPTHPHQSIVWRRPGNSSQFPLPLGCWGPV